MDEKVNALIANKANKFGEDDREWLMSLSEEQLDKFGASEAPAPTVNTEAPAPAPAAEGEAEELSLKDVMDQLKGIPSIVNEAIDAKLASNSKQPVIDRLVKNEKCPFSEATLKAMDAKELAAVDKQFNPVAAMADFSGIAGVLSTKADDSQGAGEMPKVYTEPMGQ